MVKGMTLSCCACTLVKIDIGKLDEIQYDWMLQQRNQTRNEI